MAKIICIDDDRDIIDSCKMTLESKGHTVESARGGNEGYEKAKSFKPDLIILDVMMDDNTDGFHTAYKFREEASLKYVPILMLTSINQISKLKFNKKSDAEFLPVDEFIEKPIRPDKLIEVTNKLLSLKKEQINVDGSNK
ncbi:MAG: response regulator [Oligoflexia bacterium]|nr:response regulator [Oligoflexia bacterium]